MNSVGYKQVNTVSIGAIRQRFGRAGMFSGVDGFFMFISPILQDGPIWRTAYRVSTRMFCSDLGTDCSYCSSKGPVWNDISREYRKSWSQHPRRHGRRLLSLQAEKIVLFFRSSPGIHGRRCRRREVKTELKRWWRNLPYA